LSSETASSVPYSCCSRYGARSAAAASSPRSLVSTHTRQVPPPSLNVTTSYTGPGSSYLARVRVRARARARARVGPGLGVGARVLVLLEQGVELRDARLVNG
jgi:hypothetical protein